MHSQPPTPALYVVVTSLLNKHLCYYKNSFQEVALEFDFSALQSETAEDDYGGSRAETPSTVTEVDMDLDSYQVALEEVLTWLLSAEDTFQEQEVISDDVEEVKQQFATHEVGVK